MSYKKLSKTNKINYKSKYNNELFHCFFYNKVVKICI